ncbi:EAL domain-containing protein [Sulfuricurvum sp.]|uniref:putative bifunctional diguanylate cyclase/phosphodiesterase n=1 Tax=Sulfuricurvum sp. TaxID=2025608 RepID=UPI003C3F5AE5
MDPLLSNSNFLHLIEMGPIVVLSWSTDEGWPIKYVSGNIENVLGIPSDALFQKSVKYSDFIHPEDIDRISTEVSTFISAKTNIFYQEYRLCYQNNPPLWVGDFTAVDYNDEGMALSINGYLFDISKTKEAEEKVERMIYFDTLTDLPNRQKFQIDTETNAIHACAIFNIDNFKEINDFFGIEAGDVILKQVAQWFGEINLLAYRIAGDEFAVAFYDTLTSSSCYSRLSDILSLFEEKTFFIGNEPLNLRLSVGLAVGNEKLLTRADIALHSAKEQKIPIAIYDEEDNIEQKYYANIAMANTVRKALLNGRIICHYQPIFDLNTETITKYEALVRMIDDEGRLICPLEFLPMAKKTKLYSQITRAVIHHACSTFADRSEEFSVNISLADIKDPHTVQEIFKTIIKTSTASRIVFEILESEGIENYDEVAQFITQAKSLGAKIAIDDFGSGYSNFEHILKLDINCIKIDGSLIRGIADNPRHQIIVETIVTFAQKIGASTIAEFVTDADVYETVKKLGVGASQGYYTGKPEAIVSDIEKTQ